jgi:hypothetical protein
MLLHDHQKKIVQSNARFKVIRGGRRGGKTKLETEVMAFRAISKKNRNVFYIAPTQVQARSIIWESLKSRLAGIGEISEQRLEMKVPTEDGGHSLIKVGGWENRENFRGQPADHITFDELDTMKDFFIGWQEIFRPALIDTGGSADFIGTPKKENPNLRRLEKQAETDPEWQAFHFSSWENPTLPREELEKAKKEMDADTYRQEILAEYVDNAGSLFKYSALVDMFSNTVVKTNDKYLIVDIADDGSDKTVFTFWNSLEMYRVEVFERINTESIINQIREYAAAEQIPYSHIAVDAIGVGAAVASSSLLDGIVGFKSSYQAIKTDESAVLLPGVHYLKGAPLTSDYKNLRSQCVFKLAELVNDHKIAVKIPDLRIKEKIIEELGVYQDVSTGDGKRLATQKEDIVALIGRSPDTSDTLVMRMYFVLKEILLPDTAAAQEKAHKRQVEGFDAAFNRQHMNSTK